MAKHVFVTKLQVSSPKKILMQPYTARTFSLETYPGELWRVIWRQMLVFRRRSGVKGDLLRDVGAGTVRLVTVVPFSVCPILRDASRNSGEARLRVARLGARRHLASHLGQDASVASGSNPEWNRVQFGTITAARQEARWHASARRSRLNGDRCPLRGENTFTQWTL